MDDPVSYATWSKETAKHRHLNLLIRFQQLGSPDTTVGDIEAHRSGSTLQWF
jgi:hypothetical protein